MGFAGHVARKRAEILDAVAPGPEERVQDGVVGIAARRTGESDDVAPLVDGHRRVPPGPPRLPMSVTLPFSQITA